MRSSAIAFQSEHGQDGEQSCAASIPIIRTVEAIMAHGHHHHAHDHNPAPAPDPAPDPGPVTNPAPAPDFATLGASFNDATRALEGGLWQNVVQEGGQGFGSVIRYVNDLTAVQ